MKKYDVKNDREPLSAEQVKKGMNLDGVLKETAKFKTPFFKPLLVWTSLSIAAGALIYFIAFNKKEQEKERPVVNPLLSSEALVPAKFTVDTSKDTTLIYPNGTVIRIPAGAFNSKDGKDISGPVEIAYREFHNPGDILLSGIPMSYDSAGENFQFESAGMFEIKGTKDGEPVFIKPGKPLEVSMRSLNSDPGKFNQYYLDTAKKAWDYLGRDKPYMLQLKLDKPSVQTDSTKAPATLTEAFLMPGRYNAERYHFSIEADKDEFPELSLYEEVLFEVSPETKNFDPKSVNIAWEEANIERLTGGKYKVTFRKAEASISIIGYPVAKEKEYAAMQKKYDALYRSYEQKVTEKQKQEQSVEAVLKEEISQQEKLMTTYQQDENLRLALQSGANEAEEVAYRTFQVNKFGIWNSDCPSSMPKGMELLAEFQNSEGAVIIPEAVFLIETEKNAVYSLYDHKKICFNPSNENTLIVITNKGELAWFSKAGFGNIAKGTKKFTFKMNWKKKASYTPEDINALL